MFKRFSCIALIASVISCGAIGSRKRMPEGKLISFEFEKTARSIYPVEYYHVATDENGDTWLTNISQNGDTVKVALDNNFLSRLRNSIETNKLYKLKERYTPFGDVRDGWQWRFEARFDNEESIYSECTNTRPGSLSLDNTLNILRTALSKATSKDVPKGDVESIRYEKYFTRSEPAEYFEMVTSEKAFGHGKVHRDPIIFHNVTVSNPDYDGSEGSKPLLYFDITDEQAAKITEIVKEHRMFDYDSEYQSPREISDGYMWILSIHFTSGEEVRAEGVNNGPADNGLDVLNDFFRSLIKKQ